MKTASSLGIDTLTKIMADKKVFELACWVVLLAVINLPLLTGNIPEIFTLNLPMVKTGQLWRIVTYPFAHVSIYHLLMDASAFLMIYAGLEEKKISRRLSYTAGCGIGSLLFSLLCSHTIGTVGLSGLSGIAHGLMVVTSLELIKNHQKETALFKTGVVIAAMVVCKSIVEVWTGEVVFSCLHIGNIGIPVVESHLGGVIGGIVSFLVLNAEKMHLTSFGKNCHSATPLQKS